MLKQIKKEDIPKDIREVLGVRNKEIVNTIILDIINNSLGKPFIAMSPKVFKAIVALKKFNYEHIYAYSLTKEKQTKVKEMFERNFAVFFFFLRNKKVASRIYTDFLNYKKESYINKTSEARKVLDFIAGMTDEYFLKCYEESEVKNEI